MAKKIKLALLRARNDTAYPQIAEPACISMLMANPDRTALLQYWEAVSDGYFDFRGSELMPWVDIAISDPNLPRAKQVQLAFDATLAATGADMNSFDGFLVLVHPGVVQIPNPQIGQPGQNPTLPVVMTDAGATASPNGKPACSFHYIASDFTFMCHETGHVLGFPHTFGLTNTGIDWDGKAPWVSAPDYGDPYDLMSSASFGNCSDPNLGIRRSSPTFAMSVPGGWVVQPNPNWLPTHAQTKGAGPAIARAQLHYCFPDALQGAAVSHLAHPGLNQPPRHVRLWAADESHGPRLIVLHGSGEPADGVGRVYLEFRRARGWDRGLDIGGADLAKQGVVAHTVSSTAEGSRVWYRGRVTVPVEVDTDLAVASSPVVVRIAGVDDDWRYVDLEIDIAFDRRVDLDVRRDDVILLERETGEESTPCGDRLRVIARTLQTTIWYRPLSTGYGGSGLATNTRAPVLTWSVGGRPIVSSNGSVTVDLDDGSFDIQYAVDSLTQELELTSYGGQRYAVDVVATADEATGGWARSASARFNPAGWYQGVSPADNWLIQRCWLKWAKSKRLQKWQTLRDRTLFTLDQHGAPVINQARLHELAGERIDAPTEQALSKLLLLQAPQLAMPGLR